MNIQSLPLELQPGVITAVGAFAILLAVISIIYSYMYLTQPSENLPKIGSRIRFLWGLMIVYLLALLYSEKILLLYLWLIAYLALKEFISVTPTRRTDRRVLFWTYLSIPIQFILIWNHWYRAFLLFIPVYVFLILPMIMVIIGETDGFLKAWSTLGWGILTTVFSIGYLAYLAILPSTESVPVGGMGLFIYLVGLAQLAYVLQYFFGKRFTNPRLSLKVSQTRNLASLIGSVAIVAPASWLLAPFVTPLSALEALGVGGLIALCCFIGYIILSAIKSDLQLKDRGSMTPGQGGVLNRIDAFVYTAPLLFYIITLLYYQSGIFAS